MIKRFPKMDVERNLRAVNYPGAYNNREEPSALPALAVFAGLGLLYLIYVVAAVFSVILSAWLIVSAVQFFWTHSLF